MIVKAEQKQFIELIIFIISSKMGQITAIYAKKYMNISDSFAFLSPCIAKKSEITRPENAKYIQYNVTFSHLMEYIKGENLNCFEETDEIEYGLGSIYPTPGGLRENVEHFLGKKIYDSPN